MGKSHAKRNIQIGETYYVNGNQAVKIAENLGYRTSKTGIKIKLHYFKVICLETYTCPIKKILHTEGEYRELSSKNLYTYKRNKYKKKIKQGN